MFGRPHVFFGTADEPSSFGSPSPAHKRSILSRHVVFLSQEQGEEILLLGSCITGMCQIVSGTATFSKLDLKPPKKTQ